MDKSSLYVMDFTMYISYGYVISCTSNIYIPYTHVVYVRHGKNDCNVTKLNDKKIKYVKYVTNKIRILEIFCQIYFIKKVLEDKYEYFGEQIINFEKIRKLLKNQF